MIMEKLLKLLKIKFASDLLLKDGTPITISGDLAVGVQVQVQGPDGMMDLPDGSYELETGDIISVAGGKVTDITPVVETPEEPDKAGVPVESAEVPPVETPVEEPVEEVEPVEEPNEMMKIIDELVKKIGELEAKITEIEDKTSNLSQESVKFSSDIELIKTKGNFTKEISKVKTPDVSVINTSNKNIELIERFRAIKK